MTCTSSLAQWFSADDGLPDPDTIEAPAVLVTPASVVAHGINLADDREKPTLLLWCKFQ